MMMRVKYNNFYTPRFHRKNKSFSPALSSLVFDSTKFDKMHSKNQKSKKKVVSLSLGILSKLHHSIQGTRTRSRRKTHTQRKARLFLSSLYLSFKTTRL